MKLKRILVSLLVSVMLPANVAVAEPSIGSFGSPALSNDSALIAQAALDRFEGRRIFVEVSAYNLVSGQTDSTPCIGATGQNLCQPSMRNTIATNGLPFGTEVIIPSIDPYTVWVVRDRMNSRYTTNIDVLVTGTDAAAIAEALQIGRSTREVIVKY